MSTGTEQNEGEHSAPSVERTISAARRAGSQGTALPLAFAAVLCLDCAYLAWSRWTKPVFLPPALLSVERPYDKSFSFGPLLLDDSMRFSEELPVVNATSKTIHIKSIVPGCGCSTATIEKDELEPGESTIMTLIANLNKRTPNRRLDVRLETDFDSQPDWIYWVDVEAYCRFQCSPEQIFAFDLPPNETLCCEVVCLWQSKSDEPIFTVSFMDMPEVVESISQIELDSQCLPNGWARHSARMAVRVRPVGSKGFGRDAMRLVLQSAAEPASVEIASLEIPVIWAVAKPLRVKPTSAFFGTMHPGEKEKECTIRLESNDHRRFGFSTLMPSHPSSRVSTIRTPLKRIPCA